MATFSLKCPACGGAFEADNPRRRYCSAACKTRAQNRRYYLRHRKRIIKRVMRNQRKAHK